MSSWIFLAGAIVLEVAGTTSMKLSEGFTRLGPSVALFIFYICSFILLTLALKKIEISIAYAIWSGLGTAIIAFIGYALFKEPMSTLKIFSISLIVIGVVGLNLAQRNS